MKKKLSEFGVDLKKIDNALVSNWKLVLSIILIMIVVVGIAFIAIFFLTVKSPEKVLVPDVVGKKLENALMEMQIKELYPKIQLRYSNSPDEKGTIIEQDPSSGAIVKAGRRISLVVSEGVVLDKVENYVGQKLDDVRVHLQTLFAASTRPMVMLPDTPMYKADSSEAGTVLEQYPPADTSLSEPVTLELVISSGPDNEKARIPYIVGMSLNDVLLQMSRSKIIIDFTALEPTEEQKPGTVISQKWPDGQEYVTSYSRIPAEIALPENPVDGLVYRLFSENLPPYPYALPVQLDAITPDGERYSIVTLNHPGNSLTIPYAVPQNTILILNVLGREYKRMTVN